MFLSFILMNMENFCKGKVQRFPGPWGVPSLATERKLCSNEELGMRNEGDGFAEIEDSGRSCSGIRYLTYDVSRRSG